MALTQVRAQFQGQWYTLTLNPATGYYEAEITPQGSSAKEPGGWYNVTIQAANDSGNTVQYDGSLFKSLRLVVKEGVPPTIRLISPAEGFLTTGTPTVIVEVTDEGSGLAADSLTIAADGAGQAFDREAIPNGWRLSWTPETPLSEGAHAVTVAAADYDGNSANLTLSYTVDTVPPALFVDVRRMLQVTDAASILVSGTAFDDTSGVAAVEVNGRAVPVGPDGGWEQLVFLDIGVNDIVFTARDNAGLSASQTVRAVRLITDRTEDAPSWAAAFYQWKPLALWTEAEHQAFDLACLYGNYDDIALNRVGAAAALMPEILRSHGGFYARVYPYTGWTAADAATDADGPIKNYLPNIRAVQQAVPEYLLPRRELPERLQGLPWDGANAIEDVLCRTVQAVCEANFNTFAAGEFAAGEF